MAARQLDFDDPMLIEDDDPSSEESEEEPEQRVVPPLPPWRVEPTPAEHARELMWQHELLRYTYGGPEIPEPHETIRMRNEALYHDPRFPYYARLYPPYIPGYEDWSDYKYPLFVMLQDRFLSPERVYAKTLKRARYDRRQEEVEQERELIDPNEEPDPTPEDEAIQEQVEGYFNQ
jgi:hypothetical protein